MASMGQMFFRNGISVTSPNTTVSNVNGTVAINGRTFTGNNICVRNGVITIDGKVVDPNADQVTTDADGNKIVTKWQVAEITINGDAGKVETSSGNINVKGSITGDASTESGDINVEGNIGRDAMTDSGDIEAYEIRGDAQTGSGDIDRAFKKKKKY